MNNTGPSTVPCGTPETTSALLDLEPLTTTYSDLLDKNAEIQFKTCFETPYWCNFDLSNSCGTVSNAFSKSNTNEST